MLFSNTNFKEYKFFFQQGYLEDLDSILENGLYLRHRIVAHSIKKQNPIENEIDFLERIKRYHYFRGIMPKKTEDAVYAFAFPKQITGKLGSNILQKIMLMRKELSGEFEDRENRIPKSLYSGAVVLREDFLKEKNEEGINIIDTKYLFGVYDRNNHEFFPNAEFIGLSKNLDDLIKKERVRANTKVQEFLEK